MNAVFHGQFFVTERDYAAMPGWIELRCNKWRLVHHSALPVHKIHDGEDQTIGFFVGWLISTKGRLLTGQENDHHSIHFHKEPSRQNVEDFIYQYGGRFCALFLTPDFQHVYMDTHGSLAVVYSAEHRIVASTVTLIERVTDQAVERTVRDSPPKNQYFPAGLTINPGTSRLMPNHALDLTEWLASRHWPHGPIEWVSGSQECELIATRIAERLRKNIKAIVERNRTYIGLTAGHETRLMLACSREVLGKTTFYTQHEDEPNDRGRQDQHLARKIAQQCKLQHIELAMQDVRLPLSDAEKLNYLEQVGFSGNWGHQYFARACVKSLDLNSALLMGFGGEVLRADEWKGDDTLDRSWTAEQVLARIEGLEEHTFDNQFIEAVEIWLSGLGDVDPVLAIELAYLENRVGCWAGPHLYGWAPFRLVLVPFAHREIVEYSYKLPVDYRTTFDVGHFIIEKCWPELWQYRIQSFTGPKRYYYHAKYRLGRAKKFLGRRLSGE